MKIKSLSFWSLVLISLVFTASSCKKSDACAISGPSAINVSANSATIKWNGGNAPFGIQYRQVGTATWQNTYATNNTANLTNLTTNTLYEWQVKPSCSSSFSAGTNFVTSSCPSGYTGSNCSIESRSVYYGNYTGNESCDQGQDNYTLTLSAGSSGISCIQLSNVYNAGVNATATLSDTSFTIAHQSVGQGYVDGSGTFRNTGAGTEIHFTYRIYDSSGSFLNSCTFVGTK